MSEPTPHPKSADTTDDRRTAERAECFLEVAIADRQNAFLAATVLDLSAGGVKLMVNPSPAPGDELRLTFLTVDGRLFQIPATVVHYVEHGANWAVGCRFARELDEREMEALF
jgi:c-di-GMP-binding flagellar brake protein YcgR